jgi:uncharacterized delta-60 repeat protein
MEAERSCTVTAGQLRPWGKVTSRGSWISKKGESPKRRRPLDLRALAPSLEALEPRQLLSTTVDVIVTGEPGEGGGGASAPVQYFFPQLPDATEETAFAIATDSAGNTYLGGTVRNTMTGRLEPVVVKRDAAGVEYSCIISLAGTPASGGSASVTSIAIDESGATPSLYAGLVTQSSGPGYARIPLSFTGPQPIATIFFYPGVGFVTAPIAPTRVALNSDGSLILAATVNFDLQEDLFVARISASGSPLTRLIDVSGARSNDGLGALLVRDGSIFLGGMSDSEFALVKLHSDLTLDNTFSTDGIVTADISPMALDWVYGLALQGDKIIASGASDTQMAIARFRSDGTLDTATSGTEFETTGMLLLPYEADAGVQGLAVDSSSQNIVLAATSFVQSDDFLVVRLTPQGEIDSSFGTGGTLVHDFAIDRDLAWALVQDGSSILVAGTVSTPDSTDMGWLQIDLATDPGTGGSQTRTLVITGDGTDNVITISSEAGNLLVEADGQTHLIPISVAGVPLSGIVIDVLGGNDQVAVGSEITIPVEMLGGTGQDVLLGGSGDDRIVGGEDADITYGGAGADTVQGGTGRDVLVGGTGPDRIMGNSDEDLLIDGDVADVQQLAGWREGAIDLETLMNLPDDGAADSLWGNGGLDLFVFNSETDSVFALKTGETLEEWLD